METIDGSAVEGEDYEPVNEVLTFDAHEREKEIGVTIVDDNQVREAIRHIDRGPGIHTRAGNRSRTT